MVCFLATIQHVFCIQFSCICSHDFSISFTFLFRSSLLARLEKHQGRIFRFNQIEKKESRSISHGIEKNARAVVSVERMVVHSDVNKRDISLHAPSVPSVSVGHLQREGEEEVDVDGFGRQTFISTLSQSKKEFRNTLARYRRFKRFQYS